MMLNCPQDGCSAQADSLEALRGHINASKGHDWGELVDAVDAQLPDHHGDGAADADADPDAEGTETNETEQETTEMPTQSEYEEQVEQRDGRPSDAAGGPRTDATQSTAATLIGMDFDTETIYLLAAVAIVAAVMIWSLRSSRSSSDDPAPAPSEDADGDDVDEVPGGLI
jgi:hypothetical protein